MLPVVRAQDYVAMNSIEVVRIDGNTKQADRQVRMRVACRVRVCGDVTFSR
jgi:hypothetical protein